ncbi:hypothetical protein N7462_007409 [Penicillium macrosclerotiorum]|uniref:uncharacterized protein n=1 Tax=Penicillium macrosclerotiorum TaxID=303699 RepID=UPI0025478A0D|nr:uncharacterized protein N7462_007409 [Penicillium macrosclerotiorum]KAJ5679165.1 hypothetical protein N7462_007409 [Penicillium macrosclerotiorum]
MAQSSLPPLKVPLSKQFAKFTNSTAGLDLTLRLIHALVLIGSDAYFHHGIAMRCSVAASQIGLDCFQNVHDFLVASPVVKTKTAMMEMAESSCFGMYLALEATTMLHDMNVVLVSWYSPILVEAYKFWFYGICIGILRTAATILFNLTSSKTDDSSVGSEKKNREEDNNSNSSKPVLSAFNVFNQLSINTLDLLIPGSLLGWIPVSDLGVAIAMLLSTILVWPSAWAKAQN